MNILAIYGSPSKKGNSASLADAVLKGAVENGHTIKRFYLYEQEIKNCLACKNASELHAERFCIHCDNMTRDIIPAIVDADLLIIASPIYMGHITGITKTFLDRWYTFCLENFEMRFLPEKKFITVVTSGAPAEAFSKVSEYLDHWLSKFFQMEKVDQIHAGDFMESGAVLHKKELLNKAYEIGKNIK